MISNLKFVNKMYENKPNIEIYSTYLVKQGKELLKTKHV